MKGYKYFLKSLEMAKIHLTVENQLTIDSLWNSLISRGYDISYSKIEISIKEKKIAEFSLDIIFRDSDIIEIRVNEVFNFV